MLERLAELEARYDELTRMLSEPEVVADHRRVEELARERAGIEHVVALFRRYRDASTALDEARALVRDADPELSALGHEEVERLEPEVERLDGELRVAVLPKDPADERDVIVEIRSGTGGEEAAL